MSVHVRYQRNYDQIAADHVASVKAGRGNPFQTPAAIAENNQFTVELVRRHVPAGKKLLEVGCGIGDLLSSLVADYDCVGIDIAQPYLDYGVQQGLPIRYSTAEHISVPGFGTYDCVIAADILEHVLDLNRVVKECLRVLRTSGVLIVRVPNAENMEHFMTYTTYEYVHLRAFQKAELWLLFQRIFPCEILTLEVVGDSLHCAVRK